MTRRIRRLIVFTLTFSAAASLLTAAAADLSFMPAFTIGEYAAAHVRATSRKIPRDFVDGQWQGIIAASDGRTYFGVSCHGPDNNAQFYCYDPKADRVRHLADVGAWCNETNSLGKTNTQGKIHSNIFEYKGKLYCTTTSGHTEPPRPYAAGHFLAYDLKTGACEDLGKVVCGEGKWGLLAAVFDPVYERLYAVHQKGTLYYYDLKQKAVVKVGQIEDGQWQCRGLICDTNGALYGSEHDGVIYRYNPRDGRISRLTTRLPSDPKIEQPTGPNGIPKGAHWSAWHTTRWEQMVWDPVTAWWYGVRGNDEYLVRFRPPAQTEGRAAACGVPQVEGLGSFAYPGKKDRNGTLGLALLGRRLYYVSHPVWASMAHLMSYNLDTGTFAHHGPIVLEGGRRVSEIQSLVAGSDGKLHGVAMVWSIQGQDPAKPWANRAQCYFHPRFVMIDPARDFQPASPLAELPDIALRTVEYKPGRSLLVYAPAGTNAGPRPAAVFIHGGGWAQGNPEQFALHARYYAARGLVGISVGYRLARPPETTVLDCVADVKSAVRWIRKHAGELGVDPARIVVLGDSAGGHLAAATALLPGLDAPDDDLAVSARPDALVLFNPVIDTTPPDGWDLKSQGASVAARAADLSPMDHVASGAPPTLVIHGSADTVTPLAWSERFVAAMRSAGNTARLETLEGKGHAFIVPGYGDNATLALALELTDAFLGENKLQHELTGTRGH